MRKEPSKRRVWARFMLGKWVTYAQMVRHDLYPRVGDMNVEFNGFWCLVRRAI